MPSVRALLEQIVDYAGLFPPAKLSMAQTVGNYGRYLACEDSWMLGRLIVPVARLAEFEECAAGQLPTESGGPPWQISALAASSGDALNADLDRIAAFNEIHAEEPAGLAVIDVIEMKAESPEVIDGALDEVPDDLFPFFEIQIAADPRGLIAALAGSVAGAKVRTGGATADAVPAVGDLARLITSCAAAEVPFKATAGLHHPVRHVNPALATAEFGFLNVFIAACLADAAADRDRIVAALSEDRAESFVFGASGVTWQGEQIAAELIRDARNRFAVSFGSCSFDEPREDLRRLKLL